MFRQCLVELKVDGRELLFGWRMVENVAVGFLTSSHSNGAEALIMEVEAGEVTIPDLVYVSNAKLGEKTTEIRFVIVCKLVWCSNFVVNV